MSPCPVQQRIAKPTVCMAHSTFQTTCAPLAADDEIETLSDGIEAPSDLDVNLEQEQEARRLAREREARRLARDQSVAAAVSPTLKSPSQGDGPQRPFLGDLANGMFAVVLTADGVNVVRVSKVEKEGSVVSFEGQFCGDKDFMGDLKSAADMDTAKFKLMWKVKKSRKKGKSTEPDICFKDSAIGTPYVNRDRFVLSNVITYGLQNEVLTGGNQLKDRVKQVLLSDKNVKDEWNC